MVVPSMSEIKVMVADMLDLPFADDSFDVVIEKGTMGTQQPKPEQESVYTAADCVAGGKYGQRTFVWSIFVSSSTFSSGVSHLSRSCRFGRILSPTLIHLPLGLYYEECALC
ncbi:uncharacterized protein [Spinacia oleracea]|uniref:Uncharacterized protein isoform X2 n=1 Tax=Spinacia oleracea TaxID=3562 RepID=A0ABM3R0L9_SPIOL|nr:uncharacterized protein LOC130463859 isoform X2 [Spinacia oleracea]